MMFKWVGKSEDGKTITLRKLEIDSAFEPKPYPSPDLVRVGTILDVETTGLSKEVDQIIEIGIRQFHFNRETGEVLSLGESYSAFQDPGCALSEEITILTGITDEMLAGQSISWEKVNQLLTESQIVIAHNASFDRPFIDAKSNISSEKVWGCSLNQIDWAKKGLPSQKLDVLSLYHGFFNDSHRALHDAESLLFLLSMKDQNTHSPYLLELITEARKPAVIVYAVSAPFESKDLLRERRYRWNQTERVWSKRISKELLDAEVEWLSGSVYFGAFRGKTLEIPAKDQFKARVEH